MWLNELRQRWMGQAPRQLRRRCHPSRLHQRLTLEALEERTLLSGISTTPDLIAAINAANSSGTPTTLRLASGTNFGIASPDNPTDGGNALPVITGNITIVGANDTIARTGAAAYRLFEVASSGSLTLEHLTLTNGLAQGTRTAAEGGAIYSSGTLNLSGVTIQSNAARGSDGANGFTGDPATNGAMGFGGTNGADALGGGLYVAGGSVSLNNATTFSDNTAVGGRGGNGGKGGHYSPNGGVVITSPNSAAGANGSSGGNASGGGLYVAGGSVSLSNSTISNNLAGGGRGGDGGAGGVRYLNNGGHGGTGGAGGAGCGGGLDVAAAVSSVTLSNDTFSGNNAVGGLGGLGGTGGNGTDGPGGNGGTGGAGGNGTGGGLYVASSITLTNSTLYNNFADGGFGDFGGNGGAGSANFLGSNGTGGNGGKGGHGANGAGGGLYLAGGTITLLNDTLSGSRALGGDGGEGGVGGRNDGGIFGLSPVSLRGTGGDGGDADGGGVFVPGNNVALGLTNTLIAENGLLVGTAGLDGGGIVGPASDGNTSGPDVSGNVLSSDHDLIGDPSGSSGFSTGNGDLLNLNSTSVGLDPNGLKNNGGPTPTVALVAGSQAINHGDTKAPHLPATDQRGFARIVDNIVDIGALESGATPATADVSISGNAVSSGAAGGTITYTLTVRNTSATAQSNVTLADQLPANATLVSWTAAAGWSSSAPPAGSSGGTATASIGSLAANSLATFTLVVQVPIATNVGTVIGNTVALAPVAETSTSGTNSVSFNTTVLAGPTIQVEAGGHLLVRGFGPSNAISIGTTASGGVLVDYDGTPFPFRPGQVSSIEVDTASAGGAVVTVLATPASVPLTVNAGGSGDAIDAGSGDTVHGRLIGNVDPILGPLTVNGQGNTSFTVFDSGNTTAQTYTVTASTVTRSGGFAATYAHVQSLTVNGTSGGGGLTTYNIEGTAASTAVVINGGAGEDHFHVTPTGQNLDTLASLLTLNGGGGNNFLTVDDTAAPVAESFTASASSISRSGSAGINFSGMRSAEVHGGGHGNTFAVPSLLSATFFALFVDCGSGGDTVTAGNATNGMDSLQGFLDVTDNFGLSTLILNDQASSVAAQPYTIFGSEVLWGPNQLAYGGVRSLVLDVGSGLGDRVTYEGSNTATTINTGIGSDVVQTDPAVGLIGPGPLTINGLPNSDTTFLAQDQAATTSETYTLTDTATGGEVLARSGGLVATCNTVRNLIVDGGNGGDQFEELVPATSLVTFNGGSGINSLSATEGVGHFTNWVITGPGSGRVGKLLTFTGMHDLVGTSNVDNFAFFPGGSIAGTLAGGSGPLGNILSYVNETEPVTVNLQTGAAPQIAGGAPGGFSRITIVEGSTSTNNTLIGPDANTTWTLNAANRGSGIAGSYAFNFSGFQNLVGGAGVDVFQFTATGSLAGSLKGGGAPLHQGNWLDYSALATPVTVNLQAFSATGVAGGVTNIQDVHGGTGGNTLTGDSQGNILLGGSGSDQITDGAGASLLIGDLGADTITGGSGGDLLIGDATAFDLMTPVDETALMAILAEWQSAGSYATRFTDIDTGTGGGLNGTFKLNFGTTVKDDSAADTVTAAASAAALDWFFQGTGDVLQNVEPGEHINNNTPAAFKDRTVTSPIPEGSLATVSGTITDPDPGDSFTLVVNWGDGTRAETYTFPPGSNGQRISVSHRYREEGSYTIALSWTDPTGPANQATLAVTVTEVAPVVQAGGDVTLKQDGVLDRTGSFTDPGADSCTAMVDYGDGTGPQPLTLRDDQQFVLHHKYRHPGTYQVVVTVTDDDGAVGTDTFTVTVN